MKQRLILILALVAGAAAADQYSSKSYSITTTCTTGGCTGTVPTAYSDGGFSTGASLISVDGWRLKICATAAQTIGDAGYVNCYYGDFNDNTFSFNPMLTQQVNGSGNRCWVAPDFSASFISDDYDVVACVANGIVLSTDGGSYTTRIYTHRERYK